MESSWAVGFLYRAGVRQFYLASALVSSRVQLSQWGVPGPQKILDAVYVNDNTRPFLLIFSCISDCQPIKTKSPPSSSLPLMMSTIHMMGKRLENRTSHVVRSGKVI